MSAPGATWAVILAGGDGARLQSLVALLHGRPMPKQFATLVGSRSLLQTTVERVGALAPPHRTMVVVNRRDEALARRQLSEWSDIAIVAQPENRGTALGILLPLAQLRRQHPAASVAFFPSDHHVARPAPFVEAVRDCLPSGGVTLLGVAPDRADRDLGWIVPAAPLPGRSLARVERFVEKPNQTLATELFHQGALWNSFVIAGAVADLWRLVVAHVPEQAAACASAQGPAAIDTLYRQVRTTDFSRSVLQPARDLQVARVDGAGWADWGTPERVIDSLRGTPALARLLQRMKEGQGRDSQGQDSQALHALAAMVASATRPAT